MIPPKISPEIAQLFDELLDGSISEADFLRLEAEMSVDKAVRQAYFQRTLLDMLLDTEATELNALSSTASSIAATPSSGVQTAVLPTSGAPLGTTGSGPVRSFRFVLAVAALAATALLVFYLVPDKSNSGARANAINGSELQASGYAVISGQDNVDWETGDRKPNGSLLPTGDLQLVAGVVQLELFSGVSVVIEGPAEFSVASPMHMVVGRGKVRAHVPEPAHGFRISTREADIVDLGTEFAVDVAGDHSELHVLDGEVELHSQGRSARRLATGQAVTMSASGHAEMAVDNKKFVGRQEISGRLQNAQRSRREQWLKWNERLRDDPRLVALYNVALSDSGDRRLDNRAKHQTNRSSGGAILENSKDGPFASEAAIVAAARTSDRWQHRDGALDFSPTGSRIRLSIPGEFESLTLSCWVKINSLDRWYNSLFLTDGHEQHEPHWQIMDDGRLFFSVKKRDEWNPDKGEKDKHIYYSPPFWNTALSGQWLMVSTVYDVERRQVTHFLNGDALSTESIPEEYLVKRVRIGNASICNWGLPERDDPHFAVRNLNGSLDEFILFGEALTHDEIKELHDHGKP